jgi:hypothetical protein
MNFDPAVAMNFDSAVTMIFDPAVAMIFDLAGNNKFDLHVKILRPPWSRRLHLTHFDPWKPTLRRLF